MRSNAVDLTVPKLCRMGVVNRDIKLENILLKAYETHPILKICDFGYSINENHSLPKTALGTPGYTGMANFKAIAIRKPITLIAACQQEHGLLEGCQAACCIQLHLHSIVLLPLLYGSSCNQSQQ